MVGGGAGSVSESLADALDFGGFLEVRGAFAAPFLLGAVEASDAACRSLSSWYFRRDSSGRTPFSM